MNNWTNSQKPWVTQEHTAPFGLVKAGEGQWAGSLFPVLCARVQKLVHEAALGSAEHPSVKGQVDD